ncbi:hypothetical protein [Proteus mirabilis]|uniref:hypothetical protein n=1 Tax=Proteus mirabilis TaxID=584 RepID=UPI0034D3C7F7
MNNKNIKLTEWLRDKKTIGLIIFSVITNLGNLISTIDTFSGKINNFYTWLGESSQFSGNWSNNTEGYIDGIVPDILLENKRDDIINLNLDVKDFIVEGDIHSDFREKVCDKIEKNQRSMCKIIASTPFIIEGEKSPFMNSFDAYVYEYRNGKKIIIAILNMKINSDNSMKITNSMSTQESNTFPREIYLIKLSNNKK